MLASFLMVYVETQTLSQQQPTFNRNLSISEPEEVKSLLFY